MTYDPSTFANRVLGDWDSAINRFFDAVDRKRGDLTVDQVRESLDIGYGDEIADAWVQWMEVSS